MAIGASPFSWGVRGALWAPSRNFLKCVLFLGHSKAMWSSHEGEEDMFHIWWGLEAHFWSCQLSLKWQVYRNSKQNDMLWHNSSRILGRSLCSFYACYSFLLYPVYLSFYITNLVGTATGHTALCGIRTTPRIEILSPEIQPSDPLVEWAGIEPASLG